MIVSTAYMDRNRRYQHVISVMTEGEVLAQGHTHELCRPAKDRCFVNLSAGRSGLAGTLEAGLIDDKRHVLDAVPESGAVRYPGWGHGAS